MPAKSSQAADTSSTDLPSIKSNQDVRIFPNRVVLFLLLVGIGLGLDLWTKSYMFSNYFNPATAEVHRQSTTWLIQDILGIQTSTNPGALFGIGKGLSWLFAGLSFVALTAVCLWLFVWRAAEDRWLTFALGLISGGILGNLYDRLGFGFVEGWPEVIKTDVRDWILFRLEGIPMFDPWPNFNIADSLLVTGAIMLFIHAFFWTDEDDDDEEGESDKKAKSEDETSSNDD